MNQVLEEIRAIQQGYEDVLMHYGIKRRSGRYPYGSGDDPYQHSRDFLGRIEELKKTGWTETPENIKEAFGLTTTQYRTEKSLCKDERRMLKVATAKSLKEDGLGDSEIGRRMGVNESTVRSWLNAESESRMMQARNTADFLKTRLNELNGDFLDVGKGVERELNVSAEKMKTALYILEREGYEIHGNRFEQPTNKGQFTTQKVLCPPGTEHKEIYNLDRIKTVKEYITRDGGDTYEKKFNYPASMDSRRLKIRYNEEGGLEKDGVIELRRNVADLSLGESRYAQVRILVDKSHYLKGMAVYSDDMPDGVDVVFNTNKKKETPMTDVLKKIKEDPDNPFGSAIKDADKGGQYWYDDPKTGEKKLGLINKRADEGDWSDWADTLPSQFLAKQSRTLAKKQLDLAKADKMAEYEEICSLDNPTLKKHYLDKFASSCDSAATHLKAAALPGQQYHVIIPVNSLKDNEIYAPNYKNGTELALIRYPHGGTFEIPICKVNNKHASAIKLLGTDIGDAVGINSKVAERLSGADFDGDTVMCIPTNDKAGKVKIISTNPLKGLEGFDSKSYQYDTKTTDDDGVDHYYKNGREFKVMKNTNIQMGIISNLITDMTLAGAKPEELARAVKHSMVVIDAEKHKLDYRQSAVDNQISSLHEKYQGKKTGGAYTILSKAKGEYDVDKRKGSPHINMKGTDWYDPSRPEGALIYKTDPDATYAITKTNKRTGETTTVTKTRQQKSTKMAETDDARTLVSDAQHPMELLYADHANYMKALANRARKELATTGKIKYDAEANKLYKEEVASLESKLKTALLNVTRERAANRMASAEVAAKEKAQGKMKPGDKKKASQQALTKYRQEVGSISRKDRAIIINDREWEAIQAGAISETKLKNILNNTDVDNLRQRAMPRTSNTLSQAKVNQIKSMSASNYTLREIADRLNLSTSTVSDYLKGVK